MPRLLAILCLAILPMACATRVAHVDHQLLVQPGQSQYRLDDLSLFVMPMELDTSPPLFPPGITDDDVAPVTVCIELWLDSAGEIFRLAPAYGANGCPKYLDTRTLQYESSVMQAVHGWTFSAAGICRFPPRLRAKRGRGDCTGEEVELTRVPVRLTYAFTFERHSGRSQVGTSRLRDADGAL